MPRNASETLAASLYVQSDSLRHIEEASNMYAITFCVWVQNLVFHLKARTLIEGSEGTRGSDGGDWGGSTVTGGWSGSELVQLQAL